MKSRFWFALLILGAVTSALVQRGGAQETGGQGAEQTNSTEGNYMIFDIPGASSDSLYTAAIDAQGGVAGGYKDAKNDDYGFYRAANGTVTTFALSQFGTAVAAMNANGTILGDFYNGTGNSGFVRAADGTVTQFVVPNAVSTQPVAISSTGEIAGKWLDSGGEYHFFLRDASGAITTFDGPPPPGGGPPGAESFLAINSKGEIVATGYASNIDTFYGFLRSPSGDFTMIDPPSAASGDGNGVFTGAIDDTGRVSGHFARVLPSAKIVERAYLRDEHGNYTTFAVPGTIGNEPLAADDKGTVVGSCSFMTGGYYHGYGFYRLLDGTDKMFSPPGATEVYLGQAYFSLGLPAQPGNYVNADGDITGTFSDAAGALHGFIRMGH